MPRFLILVLFLAPLAACDSGGPEVPTTANVTLAAQSARALGNCDSETNPGDYQIQLAVIDMGNNPVADLTLLPHTTYGVWPGGAPANFVLLLDGQATTFSESLALQRSLDTSGGFTVVASAIEWDADGARDNRMDDVSASRSHAFNDGVFQNVVGTQRIRVRGSSACDLIVEYSLTVR